MPMFSMRRACAAMGCALTLVPSHADAQRADLPPITITAPEARPKPRAAMSRAAPPRRPQRSLVAARSVAQPVPSALSLDPIAALPRRGDVSSSVTALPAATTILTSESIARAPVASYGDLFRAQPGMNVSNFGQGGIGYGLSMRGYTEAEHGRDIAYFIDGVPLNEVSSLHTPNYADLNILIPESVKTIAIVRGPFSVEAGDSNLGGAVYITTKDAEPYGSANVSGGTQGTGRFLGTYSTTQGGWLPYIAFEGYRTDGYRENSDVTRYNSFNKVTRVLPDGSTFSLRAQAYGTEFGAPGYASREAIENGTRDERAATNRTDGGNKQLQNIVANYASGAKDQELNALLYVNHDIFNRYADFGGGQRWQHDERTTAGAKLTKVWSGMAGGIPVQAMLGGSWRSDVIDAFQSPSTARVQSGAPVIDMGVTQHNLAAFGQVQAKPLPWLKVTAGGRYDRFIYDIDDRITPGGTPNTSNGVTSPKVGVAVTPTSWLEIFANYGEGFRSVDVPLELVGNPRIQPFRIASREIGAQITFDRLRILGSYWTTDSQNESFQAAPGLPVTFLGKARRDGFDIDARFDVVKYAATAVSLFANYGGVRARLIDAAPSFFVPNVPSYVANVGVEASIATRGAERLSGSAYVTFVGKKNISQDGLLTTSPYQRVTAKVAYAWPEGWTAFTQATWYPGDRLSEIAINFGDPVGATPGDVFVSAQPRLVALAGLSYRFGTGGFPALR